MVHPSVHKYSLALELALKLSETQLTDIPLSNALAMSEEFQDLVAGLPAQLDTEHFTLPENSCRDEEVWQASVQSAPLRELMAQMFLAGAIYAKMFDIEDILLPWSTKSHGIAKAA